MMTRILDRFKAFSTMGEAQRKRIPLGCVSGPLDLQSLFPTAVGQLLATSMSRVLRCLKELLSPAHWRMSIFGELKEARLAVTAGPFKGPDKEWPRTAIQTALVVQAQQPQRSALFNAQGLHTEEAPDTTRSVRPRPRVLLGEVPQIFHLDSKKIE